MFADLRVSHLAFPTEMVLHPLDLQEKTAGHSGALEVGHLEEYVVLF